MDIKKILVLSGITLSAAFALNIGNVQADNAGTTSSVPDTKAEFQVKAGDGDSDNNPTGLKFVNAPDLTFQGTNVKEIATKGATLNLANAQNPLQVEDYRGSDATTDWSINAQLSKFNNGNNSSLDGTITLYADKDSKTTAADDIKGASIGSASQQVWHSNGKERGVSTATATTNKGTELSIPQSTNVSAGTYSATINWTLSNTAAD
ncbi:extracellular protein [Liquorilactobacillus sucicola DSM 21376 = JCM 15457]|uniref:WxL domain-containing protein n=1 Tax=Liquorilactobacillus sucicola DSM 21376 = JCM 15457 TaxID=1423806 RepID=A0A023CZB1_9LACO|nr:WxL domain-containing protein [Liquorilactobacillus sucicola]KRN06555.1 hypothetical protein FD15_GL000102 [Liquorilactobacillus sucicola DSM 21376 = JCM 15457]GAJ27197.1 extracellular protein [Liquorilactobacillus sucicola DSM 21376 = JCM 15457]